MAEYESIAYNLCIDEFQFYCCQYRIASDSATLLEMHWLSLKDQGRHVIIY